MHLFLCKPVAFVRFLLLSVVARDVFNEALRRLFRGKVVRCDVFNEALRTFPGAEDML